MTKYKSFNGSESKLSGLQELVNFINEKFYRCSVYKLRRWRVGINI